MTEDSIEKLFYVDKKYSEIKELYKNHSEFRSFNILGKIELYNGNLKEAYKYFNKSQFLYGCCYCKFLMEDINEAKILLGLIKDSSSAANWLLCLINLLEDDYSEIPTYFQIRNFYEQDLNMLFQYNKTSFINKIIKQNQYFEYFNREIYKYSARVLLNNNQLELSKQFLHKSLDIFFKDPETHYMLGEIHQKQKNPILAKKEYTLSNEVNGGYLPAVKKLKDLTMN